MVALLPSPELQFCDANGVPYAGGTIATYTPGTTVPVTTWSESTGTVANTNPIVLDSAGRAIIYASGAVRMQLFDSLGNLIWDQNSNTIVSSAMAPVMIAPTIAAAQVLLGIVDSAAIIATNAASIIANTVAIAAEVTRAEAAETALTTALAAETARAEAAAAALRATAANVVYAGIATADATGHVRVTFPSPYPTACTAFVATLHASGLISDTFTAVADRFGADVYDSYASSSLPVAHSFYWIAVGQ